MLLKQSCQTRRETQQSSPIETHRKEAMRAISLAHFQYVRIDYAEKRQCALSRYSFFLSLAPSLDMRISCGSDVVIEMLEILLTIRVVKWRNSVKVALVPCYSEKAHNDKFFTSDIK